jgi:hypothetical protein
MLAAAFADTMALHEQVKRADPRAVGDAVAVVRLTSDSSLTSVANDYRCDLVERIFVDR